MTLNIEHLKIGDFNDPVVVFPLKQYEDLMDYIESVEDRLAITERINEPDVSKQDFDKLFDEKFGGK